jgi:hypothetical protein
MCAKWVDKSENRIDVLANQLEKHKFHDSSGYGFKGFEVDIYFTALESYFIFDEQIPQYERYFILYRAITSSAKTGKLTAKGILGNICKEENSYLNKPKNDYILATSISIKYFNELKKANRNNKSIKFNLSLPQKFDQKKAIKSWKLYKLGEIPKSYTAVQISVKARNEHEAYNLAINELDLMRGIWSLFLSEYVVFGSSVTGAEPINKVRLGALHTLHFPDGKPATDGIFWYEPDYFEKNNDISRKWIKVKSFEQKLRKYLSKHLYKKEMEDAIRRYVRALDYKDFHISFLELWIVMEKLTATTNAQYEKMVNKVAFLYKDVDLQKQVLQHLRLYRNSNVHSGERSERISNYVYQLKNYVENLMSFHINNYFKFSSIEETAAFLDLPTDSTLLKDRVNLLKKAIKYRP